MSFANPGMKTMIEVIQTFGFFISARTYLVYFINPD